MRKSNYYIAALLLGSGFLFVLLLFHPAATAERDAADLARKQDLVRRLQLTDLCLFTEARYTRHLSQADLHSAFQDYPISFEHFPSGSLTLPRTLPVTRTRP